MWSASANDAFFSTPEMRLGLISTLHDYANLKPKSPAGDQVRTVLQRILLYLYDVFVVHRARSYLSEDELNVVCGSNKKSRGYYLLR
jgi:hypothetical protein